jgi:hypothetical protein
MEVNMPLNGKSSMKLGSRQQRVCEIRRVIEAFTRRDLHPVNRGCGINVCFPPIADKRPSAWRI